MANELPFERPLAELKAKIDELRKFGEEKQIDFSDEISKLEDRYVKLEEELYGGLTAGQKMQIARHPSRPTTLDFIHSLCTDFIEFHGDRVFGDDLAIVGGIAKFNGIPVTVVGHQKGKDTKDNIARNFGSPHPDGFRKALRLMQQADKFGRPILTFLDTKGAFPGTTAEERGVGESIARNLLEMARFRVPIVVVVIGEGGSGGALALGVGNRVLMLEHAIYSVLSPEGAASILFKDASRAGEMAEAMKITAHDLLRYEAIDEIVPEPRGGAHRNPEEQAETLRGIVWKHLQELLPMSGDELVADRYEKFRKIGKFTYIRDVAEQV
ncbi:acetyl-CoA carboxylase carboxyltransferase subunit alpha [Paenibacillus flagellatus]|uniref:Acetyl-coenzyme A carboxylase carboxyl transferase subunit alpha n=1 Tax=Paenibacillus flagellatus TaxID=2211139 RepID=A0A2V5KBW9_9BACL|nr:acetyl-CoA carboxylase carboxyltransferase subunit alpha [Paenibacillus flagellatus]PYI57065.1 acetyl-CoA carboxylase carboxyl transferase subunit alpha [Paenibacillus flagellatus]